MIFAHNAGPISVLGPSCLSRTHLSLGCVMALSLKYTQSYQPNSHKCVMLAVSPFHDCLVEFWGLPPLILFFNTSTDWFGRFVLSTECYRTRKLDYNDLNWPRCSAQVTDSLALTDGGFCQKQTLNILDYVKLVSL